MFMDDTGYCYPAVDTIARHANVADKTAARGLAELTASGYLRRRRRRVPGGWPRYHYWARVPGDRTVGARRDPFEADGFG